MAMALSLSVSVPASVTSPATSSALPSAPTLAPAVAVTVGGAVAGGGGRGHGGGAGPRTPAPGPPVVGGGPGGGAGGGRGHPGADAGAAACPPRLDYGAAADTDAAAAIICSMYIVFGVVYSLLGYRCFKAVMFLTGFIFGSVIVYLICLQEKLLPAYGNAGVALAAGLLFGLVTMLVQYVGLFMTGLHTGLFCAVAGLAVADQLLGWAPPSAWAAAASLLIAGLVFAVLNLYCQKGLTVLGTSVYGGAILAGSLDYWLQRLATARWLWARVAGAAPPVPPPCWLGWLVLALWPAVALVGVATQCAVTGRGLHHRTHPYLKQHHHAGGPGMRSGGPAGQVPRTREQRAEMRQNKYRYLYQVRTAHGDVICQSYVQALQRRVLGDTSCGTLRSDSTRLTVLPPASSAGQPLTESEGEGDTDDLR
ncbi:transmembrane protein 198 isoform X2 [Schistocerca gregaria]|uniref:transmembrane protein 198 isoform X2 n=1 Tax=Schistocerca gregaria TaxID=7010 RepID=UPI00211F22CE|nr:transmembrane protein 198 isoform X2 [Schistocerca gregaria]